VASSRSRHPARAQAAVEDIDGIELDRLGLLDPASVDALAARFLASGRALHILVDSAGIMGVPLTRDARGYEAHFATSHLGHFQLAGRLWSALGRAEGARVVSVSAWAHRLSPIHFGDPHFEHRAYDPFAAYGQSKTANILFAVALDQRGRDEGIRAFSLHPGSIVDTNLSPWATDKMKRTMRVIDEQGTAIIDPESGRKTVKQGASTSVWCATSPQLDGLGGVYCENNEISPLVPLPDPDTLQAGRTNWPVGVVRHAVDPRVADRL
jgi:NAD(P)-dependent dehydrogenase (short-subunit alcohol dehydrogenase family)